MKKATRQRINREYEEIKNMLILRERRERVAKHTRIVPGAELHVNGFLSDNVVFNPEWYADKMGSIGLAK